MFIYIIVSIIGLIIIFSLVTLTSKIHNKINFMKKMMYYESQNNNPRQLQDLTKSYTMMIKRDFPEFDVNEFLASAENVLVSILNSIENGSIIKQDEMSPNLVDKLDNLLCDIRSKNEKWRYDDIYIHKSCISRYITSLGSKTINVEIALQYRYKVERDGEIINNGDLRQYKYSLDALYVQDETKFGDKSMKGHNCPNCGAPVKQLGKGKYCPYCGTGLTEVNSRIWTFDNYIKC